MTNETPPPHGESSGGLKPHLNFYAATLVVIGAVIGSGIFRKPTVMAASLGTPGMLLAVWIVGGIITLFGALTIAEIAGMRPHTGGQYMYFREQYGDWLGFLYGWGGFTVVQSGTIASLAYVFSDYAQFFVTLPRFAPEVEKSMAIHLPFLGTIFPLESFGVKLLTIVIITSLTIVNCISARSSGILQSLFTVLKVSAIAVIILAALGLGFGAGKGNVMNFSTALPSAPTGLALGSAFIMALQGAFWSYEGWNNITFIAGEIKEPHRNIPRALFVGMMTVIVIYVLINIAYLTILPIDKIANSTLVASDVAQALMGNFGAGFVSAAVMISTLGTANVTILAASRVFYAMAREGMFFPSFGKTHARFHTPVAALIAQGVWACVLTLSGTFDMLTDMLVFVSWLYYGLAAFGIFIFRRKFPNDERPYKAFGYPVVPIVFVLFSMMFVGITLYTDITTYIEGKSPIINSVFGLALLLPGIPLYFYFRKSISSTVHE